MDPMTAASLLSAGVSAGTGFLGAAGQQEAAKAQQAHADRQALEERSAGQRAAAGEMKRARAAQSSLVTQAGASGSGASDPTVMQLFGDIEGQGRVNAGVAMADSERRADNMVYQASLDRWKADADARMKRIGAVGTLIGGGLKAYASPMAQKYGSRWQSNSGWGDY